MKQSWIYKPLYDLLFILMPPYFCLGVVFCFSSQFISWGVTYDFWSWLLLIVFIDVAHTYSTLYKTYLNKNKLDIVMRIIPLASFLVGIVVYMNSYKIFWSILAYFAVFHFIRQQYGIVKLYSKRESDFQKKVGSISVYNATIYPMLFWFGTDDRVFNWFLSGEFYQLRFSNNILLYLKVAYILLILLYISIEIYQLVKNRVFNVPKNLLMISTYLTWYFGIVYFNNDLIFTLLNIVSHGVPYIALIYFNQREESHLSILPKMSTKIGLLVFLVIILSLAMVEEYLWEILVWEEKIWVYRFVNPFKKYDWILVPLLSVPQITHYILDGRIWRRTKAV